MNDTASLPPWWQRLRLRPRRATPQRLPTGHASLDAALPGGGWQAGQVLEVCGPQEGVAAWRLLETAIERAARAGRPVALVQPPHAVHRRLEPGFGTGPLSCCWPGPQGPRVVEAGVQWLQTHPGGMLLLWASDMPTAAWRALSRAARRHAAHVLLMRPASSRWDDSPADVRLSLLPGRGRHWDVHVQTPACAAAVLLRVSLDEAGGAKPSAGLAPMSALKVAVDPTDRRRTALCGTLAQVCDELERLARREAEGWPLAA
ncbi:MAG: hypothetical protein KatS3mg122_2483 [Caldimonas sp.]|nr:MAG: hypothetical protein KatS3mg122_2483 [Caldimonas sp.]